MYRRDRKTIVSRDSRRRFGRGPVPLYRRVLCTPLFGSAVARGVGAKTERMVAAVDGGAGFAMTGMAGWAVPHHDGSATYVGDLAPELGDTVPVYLRVPRASGVREALLRVYVDGEQELRPTVVDREDEHEFWLRGDVPLLNPVVNYRWLLDGVPGGYQWLNGEGLHAHDVTDAADFRISAHPAPPAWAQDAVLYQIFPDRFARSTVRPAPDWAVRQDWDDPVIGDGPDTAYQLYGGDLDGITAHLDHIASTGANTVYLTPVFPARSNHRYDASTFDRVDPLLGGDEALIRLSDALHARGMRLLGDLTTNHCGDGHEWFRAAVADRHHRRRAISTSSIIPTPTSAGSVIRLCPSSTIGIRACAAGCTTARTRWSRAGWVRTDSTAGASTSPT